MLAHSYSNNDNNATIRMPTRYVSYAIRDTRCRSLEAEAEAEAAA